MKYKVDTSRLSELDTRNYPPMYNVGGVKFQASPTPGFKPVMGCPHPLAFVIDGWTFYAENSVKLMDTLVDNKIFVPAKG